jgi:hypothetical protein
VGTIAAWEAIFHRPFAAPSEIERDLSEGSAKTDRLVTRGAGVRAIMPIRIGSAHQPRAHAALFATRALL